MIARDPSLEEAIRSAAADGQPAAWAVDRAIDEFPDDAARARRLHGRARRGPRRRPRPDRRPAARATDARAARARRALRPGRGRPGAGRHRDAEPGEGARARHGQGRPDKPHRHPRQGLGPPRRRRLSGAATLREGELVEVDGETGQVRVGVTPDEAGETNRREAERRAARAASRGPGRTADGHAVALLLNIGDAAGAAAVAKVDAEGVGLFRTEFLYLDRQDAPSVDEQVAIYTGVFEAMAGQKIVVRTLDAGADKPLPFLNQEGEPNPALGVRGLRTARRSPQVLGRSARRPGPGAAGDRRRRLGHGAHDRHGRRDEVVHRPRARARPPDRRGHGRDPGRGAARRRSSSSTPTS